jgi:HEAT repeats
MNSDRIMTTLHIADKSLAELECLYSCNVDDDDFYMVIAYNIALESLEYLKTNLGKYSGRRLRGALFALGTVELSDETIDGLLVGYLTGDDWIGVAEAIDALRSRKHTKSQNEIERLQTHSSPYVRGAVLRYLRFVNGRKCVGALIAALSDPHEVVRQNAIDELAEVGDTESLEHVRRLLRDPDENVRAAAASALGMRHPD